MTLDRRTVLKSLVAGVATAGGLLVQIALSMGDPRPQFPPMPVPEVDPAPLADLLPGFPKLQLVLLNAGYWGGSVTPHVRKIREAGNV